MGRFSQHVASCNSSQIPRSWAAQGYLESYATAHDPRVHMWCVSTMHAGRTLTFTWVAVFVGLIYYSISPDDAAGIRLRLNVLFRCAVR